MAITSVLLNIDEKHVASALQAAREKLDCAEGDAVLDFSSVPRIDADGLRALETLARSAEDKAVKVVLRGVNVNVYKVLKLVRLTHRFSFTN